MFKMRKISTILLFLLVVVSVNAQTSKRNKKTVPKQHVQSSEADMLYEDMLFSTDKIMIIDSVVVDKSDLLKNIPLGNESGQVLSYDDFMKTKGHPGSFAYIDGFGNKAIFSLSDSTGTSRLYTSDRLGGKWNAPQEITDFESEYEDVNNPFLMPDGTTLYFSAKGKNGLGGYDIYVTSFDVDSAKFRKPENIGLPYNSKANDYYYIIDEFDSIGWLVTDRRQPEGKVCIYTFVPSESRTLYDASVLDEEKIKSFADIRSIKDTWTDAGVRTEALYRLRKLLQRNKEKSGNSISFIINDNTEYVSESDFKSPSNRERFKRLCVMKETLSDKEETLESQRAKYHEGNSNTRKNLASSIIEKEKEIEKLRADIKRTEKEIRNTENTILTNNKR